jgi:hypothetical protein
MPDSSAQLSSGLQKLFGAIASGNTQSIQEAIREFNLGYANDVAQLYGQNWGPGQPAPIGAATLAAGSQFGSIGYIPGYTGSDAGQIMSQVAQNNSIAQNAAGLTGWYAAPVQSSWTPGTFVRLDPSTYDTQQYGDVQISYVLPSGQLQRVNIPQAKAMGWNGDLSTMNTIPATQAIMLEKAPPQNAPQQTIQGLTAYSNLNTAAQNNALAVAGATGMFTAPGQVVPPGTNMQGGKFQDLPQDTQMAYFMSNGSDWNAAMNKWVADSNAAIQQAYTAAGGQGQAPGIGTPGTPQETLAAQNQYFTQAADLANQFGQYYTPLTPGQTAQAGVNAPAPGTWTQAAQQQAYAQQMGAIQTAASLQANPFRQQQVIGQLGPLLTGATGVPGFSAPNTVAGVGTQGGNTQGGMGYMQQMIDDIRAGTNGANQTSMQSVLNAIPTPNKVNSVEFMRAAPSTQQMVLQGMQEKYGLDPQDSMTQIKNTLPAFTAPTTFGKIAG